MHAMRIHRSPTTLVRASRRRFIATTAAALAGAGFSLSCSMKSLQARTGPAARNSLSPLQNATAWLNSPPLTGDALGGKAVLINFCTYSCINWLRQLPYVRAWDAKYRDRGLALIGVHTPEFGFERDVEKVRGAAKSMQVTYPLAVDNDYTIWNAFENRYWPALYFIDARGTIRHRQFGEGNYDQAERMIQALLAETKDGGISRETVTIDAQGVEAAPDWANLRSPEIYLGANRTEKFVARRSAAAGSRRAYVVPPRLQLNEWSLGGEWTVRSEAVFLDQPPGRIACRFHARDLHLVIGPAQPGARVRFQVRIDGQPPGAAHGADVDDQGSGVVVDHRLYQLIRQRGPIPDRQFEIEFLDPGAEAFSFTFG